jgi:uncharacterized membrane protein
MVLPRFSLRFLLLLTAVFAVASLVFAEAYQGRAWAIAFTLTMLAAAGLLVFHASVFWIATGMRLLFGLIQSPEASSPFAVTPGVKQVVAPPAETE